MPVEKIMPKEQKTTFKSSEKKLEGLALPRRGFLQKCALVTGAFLVGTLRIDKPFAQNSGLIEHYCCFLTKPKVDCPLRECASQFYWVCSYWDQDNVPYLIRCVECFNTKISSEGKIETLQAWTETMNRNIAHLKCSRAVHPEENDFTVFNKSD
ncbi:MAG: twin-arginine translocation signal domain-containing protein [Gammaproteobacteria bacterium]|nr:twin-arginine translocation signal domain-containing protein [Gammaproteobacteria bacterium]MYF38657.1 twin-arginine translocation signal domain-containing protein [Gammaproteobacteria bacterium]